MSFHPFIYCEGRLHDFFIHDGYVVALQPLNKLVTNCRILLSASIWNRLTCKYSMGERGHIIRVAKNPNPKNDGMQKERGLCNPLSLTGNAQASFSDQNFEHLFMKPTTHSLPLYNTHNLWN